MSDGIVRVETARDLHATDINTREREAIANLLSSGATAIVWLPEWLLSEKDVTTLAAYPYLAVGQVEDYSEKAYQLIQSDTDAYLPKSEVYAFVLADGVEEVETPQAGLTDFKTS